MILEKVPTSLRGELTRWMIEPHSGLFVGHLSAMVRDKLWENCCNKLKEGAVVQIWSTNNEQRFEIRSFGDPKRAVVDFDGLQLIRVPLTKKLTK